jgi:TonB-dependent receptor
MLTSIQKSLMLILVYVSTQLVINAQTGILQGIVVDKNTKELLAGANIYVDGAGKGSRTDMDGKYSVAKLTPGKYNVKFMFMSYEPIVLESVEIVDGQTTMLNAFLEPKAVTLNSVGIVGTRKVASDIAVINTIKNSQTVVSGVSSQQIQKSQDRDASEVVKRIPGITIMDDRFIVVRGLNQRYNNVWLNNAPVPSSETDVRAFSFDVIPSGLIDNVLIYKNGVPELPADVAGGFIKVTTKNMPDSNFFSIDVSTSYRGGTTGKEFYMSKGSKLDWLGVDDGTRALPSGFTDDISTLTDRQVLNLAKSFEQNWVANKSVARPDMRLGFTFGYRFRIKSVSIGNTSTVNYSNALDTKHIANNSYVSYDLINNQPDTLFRYSDQQYTDNVKTSVMHNWSIVFSERHKIEFKNLFNQIGFNRTVLRSGYDYYHGADVRSYEYRFMSRTTYAGQLDGAHSFGTKTKLNWNVDYAYANRNEPDRKVLTSQKNATNGKYYLNLTTTANPHQAGRLYLRNDEYIYAGGVNFEHKFDMPSVNPVLKIGYFQENKNRTFKARNIGIVRKDDYELPSDTFLYLPIEQIFTPNNYSHPYGLTVDEKTNKSDSYTARNDQYAGYTSLGFSVTDKMRFYMGARIESNRQRLSSYLTGSLDQPVTVDHKAVDIFPSASGSYYFNDKTLVRAAYSRSLNRPEFREIAPFVYFDFNDYASYQGNSDLKNAYIQNYDLRFENYPAPGETFSLALFYKDFTNPIEMTFVDIGSGLQYSFKNTDKARSYGVEFEGRKSLAFISGLEKFAVMLNASLIQSRVQFHSLSDYIEDRSLQGQSPYILNTGIYYNNVEKGFMVSALLNVMGPRIMVVGVVKQNANDNIPDIYEMQTKLLDITFAKKLGRWFEVKGGVKNLLDDKTTFQQEFKETLSGGENISQKVITKQYKQGVVFSIGLSAKF